MNKKLDDFACFILCHGRPDNTPTYDTLRNYNYTGKTYIICDDEDSTLDGYKQRFGADNVKVFSKQKILKQIDTMTSEVNMKCAVYARNACFDIAEELGLKYFCELDDDYVGMPYRFSFNNKLYRSKDFETNLDEVFEAYLDFLETSENIYSVAFAQPGDLIGGLSSQMSRQLYVRKAMNSWICKTERRFKFNGVMNDDVNTFCINGAQGKIFISFPFIMIDQPETQQVKGGMTELYLGKGTYQKSFFTVMLCPSFVTLKAWGDRYYRIHHSVDFDKAYPCIISDKYKRRS